MNVKKYIKNKLRQGHSIESIKKDFINLGYDEAIVDAEIDAVRRDKAMLAGVYVLGFLAVISPLFFIKPSVTAQVIRVRVGAATHYITNADLLGIFLLLGILFFFVGIIVHRHFGGIIGREVGQGILITRPKKLYPKYIAGKHDRAEAEGNHLDAGGDSVEKLAMVLQQNYDGGFSLNRLYSEVKARGWKEEDIQRAFSRLKVKEADEIVKGKIC